MDTTDTQLDPDVINLAKATRQYESGNDPAKKGGSGEYGYYQYLPATWDTQSKAAGVHVPLEQATPEQQNQVWYTWAKGKKDAGYNIGQILSMQNAGEGKPNAYLEGNTGTNKYGVKYDTADYAKKIAGNYQQLKTQSSFNPTPYSTPGAVDFSGNSDTPQNAVPTTDPNSLGGELADRVTDASTAINSIVGGKAQTGQSRLSGLLQTAGAVGGAVGDVLNKGLELIPGVKAIEGVIGNKVGQFMQTDAGKSIAATLKETAAKHPELTKDAGAVLNIVTAIPILRGLGAVKNVVLDASAQALKGAAEKSVTNDLTATLNRTIGGRTILQSIPEAIPTLVKERALPEIVNGKYATEDAYNKLGSSISTIEDTKLQPTLKMASTSGIDTQQPLETIRQEALADVRQEFKATGQVSKAESEINRVFDDYKSSYGDYVSLEDVNAMKRGIRKSVNFNSPKLESDVTYHIGQMLQQNIEQSAKTLGLSDIGAINQEMADLIKAQKALKFIDGKPVKTGLVGGFIKDAATAGGEVAGNATGIPLAGAYVGREIGGGVGKKLSGITQGILKRTGKDAIRTSGKTFLKKATRATKAGLLQKAIGS